MNFTLNDIVRSDTPDGLDTQCSIKASHLMAGTSSTSGVCESVSQQQPGSLSPVLLTSSKSEAPQTSIKNPDTGRERISFADSPSLSLLSPELGNTRTGSSVSLVTGPVPLSSQAHLNIPFQQQQRSSESDSKNRLNEPRLMSSESFGSLILGMLTKKKDPLTQSHVKQTRPDAERTNCNVLPEIHGSTERKNNSISEEENILKKDSFMAHFYSVKKDMDRNLESAVTAINSSVSQFETSISTLRERFEQESDTKTLPFEQKFSSHLKRLSEEMLSNLRLMDARLKQSETHLRLLETQNKTILSQQNDMSRLLHLMVYGSLHSDSRANSAILNGEQMPNMKQVSAKILHVAEETIHVNEIQGVNQSETTSNLRELEKAENEQGQIRSLPEHQAPHDVMFPSNTTTPFTIDMVECVKRDIHSLDDALFEPPSEISSQINVSEVPQIHDQHIQSLLVDDEAPEILQAALKPKSKRGRKRKIR